jgi:hypothetical protein
MKHRFTVIIIFVLVLAGRLTAQPPNFNAPGGLPPGFPHALLDVFATVPAFHGRIIIQVPNGASNPPSVFQGSLSALSGSLRLEVNSFDPGTNMPADEVANLRQLHPIYILRPDKNRMYTAFPTFKSYLETGYYKRSGDEPAAAPQISKGAPTKETLGDQPCAKTQWSVTEASGEHHDITVWTATNLNNFPIQLSIDTPPTLVNFQDLLVEPPEPGMFDPPEGYMRYSGMPDEIQKAIDKSHTNAPAAQ